MKIGKMYYGISEEYGAWSQYAGFEGRVVSFDEETVVLWATVPDHDGDRPMDDEYPPYEMMFLSRKEKLFETEKERDENFT